MKILKMDKATQAHHAKYLQKAIDNNITLPELSYFHLNSIGELLEKYKKDEHLNNIPINLFDKLVYTLSHVKGHSLSDSACIYKALLKQLLIDKNLLDENGIIDNKVLQLLEESKKINNWLDCDVIQDAINNIENRKNNSNIIDQIEYLKTSVLFRKNDNINYFLRLINEIHEILD